MDFCFEEKCVGLRTRFASYGKSLNDMAKIAKADPVSGARAISIESLSLVIFFKFEDPYLARGRGYLGYEHTFEVSEGHTHLLDNIK